MQALLKKCLVELAAENNLNVGMYVKQATIDCLTSDLARLLEANGVVWFPEPEVSVIQTLQVPLDICPLIEPGLRFTLFPESKNTSKEVYFIKEVDEKIGQCIVSWGNETWNNSVYPLSRVIEHLVSGTWIVELLNY